MEATTQKTEPRHIQSRVGKRPIIVPKGVTAALKDGAVKIEGPKGKLSRTIPAGVDVKIDGGKVTVTSNLGGRDASRMQGADGYARTLELRGTGYRAEMKGTTLNMALGFSHPIIFPLPQGIKVEIPADSKGTILNLSGADKELMGQTAAKIRGFRPPEPYGGKGVRYQGEKVREKAGKAGKGGKTAK